MSVYIHVWRYTCTAKNLLFCLFWETFLSKCQINNEGIPGNHLELNNKEYSELLFSNSKLFFFWKNLLILGAWYILRCSHSTYSSCKYICPSALTKSWEYPWWDPGETFSISFVCDTYKYLLCCNTRLLFRTRYKALTRRDFGIRDTADF